MAPILLPPALSSQASSSASKFKQRMLLGSSPSAMLALQQQQQQQQLQIPSATDSPSPAFALAGNIRPSATSLVRDFAYPTFHPLHLGPAPPDSPSPSPSPSPISRRSTQHFENEQHVPTPLRPQDGPPWAEDAYLSSPIISTAAGGEREYFFSVASADDEIHGRAVALFDFEPENDNEVGLREGQEIWISYRHGQGWLVAQDPVTGESGLVPEEYVHIFQRDAFPEAAAAKKTEVEQTTATTQPERIPDTSTGELSPRRLKANLEGTADDDGWEDVEE